MARRYLVACLLLLSALPFTLHANTRTPTAAELEQLKRFGLGNLGMVSDKDLKLLYGSCPSDPYTMLENMRTGTNVRLRPSASGQGSVSTLTSGIDPVLACRLTKLFEFAQQNGCSFRINSAYRNEQDQARACTNVCGNPSGCAKGCAPPGGSCHQYGLAIDVTGSQQCLLWLRRVSPQFELHFPYSGNHLQCKEHKVASCNRSTPSCNGSIQITADPRNLSGPNASSAPLGLDSIFRNALGQQPPPLSTPLNAAQQNSLNSAFSPTGTPSPSLSFVNTTTEGGSVADTLQGLISGTTTGTTTSVSGGVAVTINTADVAYLTPPITTQNQAAQTGTNYVVTPNTGSSQTFISPDLAHSYAPQGTDKTVLQRALSDMRAQLASALVFLQPFGGLGLGDVHE